jgi:hypothetical protein
MRTKAKLSRRKLCDLEDDRLVEVRRRFRGACCFHLIRALIALSAGTNVVVTFLETHFFLIQLLHALSRSEHQLWQYNIIKQNSITIDTGGKLHEKASEYKLWSLVVQYKH